MADVFISYSSEDRQKAQHLARVLEGKGWSVWWDPKIPPGKTYDEVVGKAVKDAHCVIVLWSDKSVQKRWVKAEAAEGKQGLPAHCSSSPRAPVHGLATAARMATSKPDGCGFSTGCSWGQSWAMTAWAPDCATPSTVR